jgi:hypothetical protein
VRTPEPEPRIVPDCGGDYRTWGCGCSECIHRRHPLDLGMRLPREKIAEWGRLSDSIDRRVTRQCISCRSDKSHLYAGGWFCDDHSPRTAI